LPKRGLLGLIGEVAVWERDAWSRENDHVPLAHSSEWRAGGRRVRQLDLSRRVRMCGVPCSVRCRRFRSFQSHRCAMQGFHRNMLSWKRN